MDGWFPAWTSRTVIPCLLRGTITKYPLTVEGLYDHSSSHAFELWGKFELILD
jgi:hypothetical protein